MAGRRNRRRSPQAGFTLIELLIVVAIIGLLAALAMPNLRSAMDRAKANRTMADMKVIGNAIELYSVDSNTYPKGLTDADSEILASYLAPLYLRSVPKGDGWNNRWHVESNATGTSYSIISYGRDGAPGPVTGGTTSDPNCDIVFTNNTFFQWPQGAQQ